MDIEYKGTMGTRGKVALPRPGSGPGGMKAFCLAREASWSAERQFRLRTHGWKAALARAHSKTCRPVACQSKPINVKLLDSAFCTETPRIRPNQVESNRREFN